MELDSRALSLLHGKTETSRLLWSNVTTMQPCSAESRMVMVVHCKLKSCLCPCMLDQGDSLFRISDFLFKINSMFGGFRRMHLDDPQSIGSVFHLQSR